MCTFEEKYTYNYMLQISECDNRNKNRSSENDC